MRGIELQFDMQTVMDEQQRVFVAGVAVMADELSTVGKLRGRSVRHRDFKARIVVDEGIAGGIAMAAASKRYGLIEEGSSPRNNFGAAFGVVGFARRERAVLRYGIGAVERIIETAPPGVRRVECETRVGEGHDQLRTRQRGDFRIDIGGGDFKIIAGGFEVTDLGEELTVGRNIKVGVAMAFVPGIDFLLQAGAVVQ